MQKKTLILTALSITGAVALAFGVLGIQVASASFVSGGGGGVVTPVSVANGGTGIIAQTTNGVTYSDGAHITSAAGFTYDGNSTVTLGTGTLLFSYGASSTDSNAFDVWNPLLAPLYPYFTVRSSGFVGVATSTPRSQFTVAGNASVGADSNIAAPANGLAVEGGIISSASSTFGGGTQTTGVTINGGATSTATVNITNNASLNITGSGQINLTNGASWSLLISQGSDSIYRINNGGGTKWSMTSGGVIIQNGTAPSAATSTGSGTGNVPVTITGNPNDFNFNITTGTAPTANATIATFTLTNSCSSATIPTFSPATSTSAGLFGGAAVIASSTSASTFVLIAGTSSALKATTNYIWNFHVGCY